MQATRSHYLQAMGITQWRLRPLAVQSTLGRIGCYRLLDSQRRPCGLALLALTAEISLAEQELLTAIVKALKMTAEAAPLPNPISTDNLILFGHDLPTSGGKKVVATHSLAEMLANPSLKAKVWRDLQVLITG